MRLAGNVATFLYLQTTELLGSLKKSPLILKKKILTGREENNFP